MSIKPPKKAEITLEFQNYMEHPPFSPERMINTACSSDNVTINTWRDIWLDHVKKNKTKFGSFKDRGIGKLFGSNSMKPCIVAGSGPSLARNGHLLKDRKDIPLISCLHNYHFFEDRGITPDYYVTLDAGDVVLEEVSEGGSKTADEYWDSTKNKKLCAFIGTSPKLFEKWQGEVILFNAPVPDPAYMEKIAQIEVFNTYIGNGGNVLGACMYIAKGIFGSNPIAFTGADFAFGYDRKFHAWSSKYDQKLGNVMRTFDIYGNKVLTWQSYFNFKNWFDFISLTVPGLYINCTEGGTLGAFAEGNIMSIKQMNLEDFIEMYTMHEVLRDCCENPENEQKILLF